ncbi:MAG: SusC/RagA family TonB-linked outer membrane protein, partial [Bacteroidales bacterium]|nr:SusC/RagA family TonB-linked outer membrane protein [Bacteroidales bacterium]
VIIITTKKGKGNGVHVSYSGSVSVKQNASTLKMMDGPQFKAYIEQYHPEAAHLLGVNGVMSNTDWQKEIYRIAINTDHNVSVYSGGAFPFRASIGYNLDQATIKTGDNQRGNIDISLSPKFLDDHLSINFNAKGVYQHTNWANNAVGSALSFDPTKPIYFTDASGKIDKSFVSNGYWNWLSAGSANTMAGINPLSSVYDYNNFGNTIRGIGNLQIDYKVHGLEDLRANVNLGLDLSGTNGTKYNTIGSISAMRSDLDLYETYKNYNRNALLEAYLDYNHTFSDIHNLDVMAGYSWQHNYVRYDNSQYYNTKSRELYNTQPTNAKEYYLLSFFGRVNYSIASKYLFTFTARADASSRFSPANRWGFFPSAAFAWNLKNEEFLKYSHALSALKLRLGWGRTGQQDIGSDYYPYLARYYSSQSIEMQYPMGSGFFNTLSPLAYNPNIKWETTETFNAGIDFGFADDRVTGSVEGYYRRTFDLLNNISIPLGSNFGKEVISNIGEMVNKGIELSLNYIAINTSDVSWEIGGNITFQDVKITKLTNDDKTYLGVETGTSMGSNVGFSSLHRAGYAPYTYYLYQQLYDNAGNPIQNALVDRNGDGVISSADRYITGCSPTPWAYYGVTTQLRIKNWDLGLNGHGSIGAELINKNRMGYTTSYSDAYTKGYINNLSADFLIPGWHASHSENQKYSDLFIEDASFFKIDDINLGYTFNFKNDTKLRLAASVQNVCTFTKYSGLDPEIDNISGVDTTIYPRPRLYTFRLNFTF